MPAVSTYSPTGDAYLDGVLSGLKWGVNNFTFSFPGSASYYGSGYGNSEPSSGFEAMNATQKAVTRDVLSDYASVGNIAFSEISETLTQHADLRFAESDVPGTAWAYYPHTAAEGGDVWFNNSKNYYDNPAKGNYAYTTFLHEIGHALGLKHPHEVSGSFGAMPVERDSMEYTIMSYRSYTVQSPSSGGYTNEAWGYAQSLMMYDIAAVQRMYGANYNTNSGATTYTWSAYTGEMFINGVAQGAPGANKIFLTVWDGGGLDTYDLSKYSSDLKVDLQPGEWTNTSTAQLVRLHYDGSKLAVGNIANALLYNNDLRSLIENAIGGAGNDALTGNVVANVLRGGAGNDRLTGGGGNDTLYGDSGTDTAAFSGTRSQYVISQLSDGSVRVADLRTGSHDGINILWGMENLEFSDRLYAVQDLTTDTTDTTTSDDEEVVVSGVTLNGTSSNNTLTGGAGKDTLNGLGGADKLHGNGGDDHLDGGTGDDSLYGGDGNDVLVGGSGRDRLEGGAGSDSASYATANSSVTASLSSPSNNRGDAYRDSYVSIENLTGGFYADTLTGNGAANALDGGAGNDKLYGLGGNDKLIGGRGNDVLDGGTGTDTALFSGLASEYSWSKNSDGSWSIRDVRSGSPDGTDRLVSIETLQFADKIMTVQELTAATDTTDTTTSDDEEVVVSGVTLNGTSSNNTLTGGAGKDTLNGLGGADKLHGNGGDDHLDGGTGDDSLYGGDGNDVLVGGSGRDRLEGGAGSDSASYATANSSVTASLSSPSNNRGDAYRDSYVSIENLTGGFYADTLTGNGAANALDGGAGNDKLYGLGGNDKLIGGRGNDVLDGGTGTDTALFSGLASEYSWSKNSDGSWSIRDVRSGSPDGTDRLVSIETLQFSDLNVSLGSSAANTASSLSWSGKLGGGRSSENGGSKEFSEPEQVPLPVDLIESVRFAPADGDYLL